MRNYDITFDKLIGKTIKSIEVIPGECGRTYDAYLGFACTDGTRVMIFGNNPYNPCPSLETMQNTNFFTPEEIGDKASWDAAVKKRAEEDRLESKRRELDRLKKELGV